MHIQKLDEFITSSGREYYIGGKRVSGYYTYNLVFGPYKNNMYTLKLASPLNAKSGSYVMFKDQAEFDNFNSNCSSQLEPCRRYLDDPTDSIIQVQSDFGPVWMKKSYYDANQPVDAKEVNKLARYIRKEVMQPISKEAKGLTNSNSYSLQCLYDILNDYLDELKLELINEFNLESNKISIVIQHDATAINLSIERHLNMPDEVMEEDIKSFLADYIQTSVDMFSGVWHITYTLNVANLSKLREKIINKALTKLDNLQAPTDYQAAWNIAKEKIRKEITR